MKSKKAFITGVSSGLGMGMARAVLEGGGEVWGCSRRENPELAEAFPGRFHFQSIDLKNAEAGMTALRQLLKEVPSLDYAILNAGVLPPIQDMRDTDLDSLRETMEINLWANKWIIDGLVETVPSIRQIVAISSGAAVSGSRGWNGYSLSKAALNMLIKLYATELPDIHFAALAPGLIDTAMQDYLTGLPDDERFSTVARLKQAKGTSDMPDAATAGKRCVELLPKLAQVESGSFVDIRKFQG